MGQPRALALLGQHRVKPAMTAYSSGLALQAVDVRIRRSRSVAIDGTLGVALTLYAPSAAPTCPSRPAS